MSTNRIALFFCLIGLLTVFPSSFAGQDCTCGSIASEPMTPVGPQAYEDVERIIKRIRGGNLLPQPDSTIIHFDGTPIPSMVFQKRLAPLPALQLPIDKSCHPALVITYFTGDRCLWYPDSPGDAWINAARPHTSMNLFPSCPPQPSRPILCPRVAYWLP
ncbi:hypothetical protein TCAL_17456 [Tigriopus californicus]|uniref:Uncharacterized protein n=1 Tax=Tigriopus californicus TaxID=6832 RepID=A0A553N8U7_TIGCA|nr:hypothetical protein TCAL_17456 [Tigriopus californicus]